MVGRTAPILKPDQDRFTLIKTYCGCLLCLLDGLLDVHATIQHVVEGYRLGHQYTYGSDPWHHQGVCWPGMNCSQMEANLGPSMELNAKNFHERYGSELLLVELQDFELELFAQNPWPEYNISRQAAKQTRARWTELKDANAK